MGKTRRFDGDKFESRRLKVNTKKRKNKSKKDTKKFKREKDYGED